MAVELELFSDVVCPWCFIGKRRLAAVRKARPELEVSVRWRAFELQPGMPAEGTELRPFFEKKFGGSAAVERAFARVTEIGAEDGIRFDFPKQQRAVNSRLAHRAIKLAAEQSLPAGDAVMEACMSGYFEQGIDIGSPDALLAHLTRSQVPVDLAQLGKALREGGGQAAFEADMARVRQVRVTAVPFFLLGSAYAMSGAGAEEELGAFLEQGLGELGRRAGAPN